MTDHPKIVITIDIDWAPDLVLEDTLKLLERYDVQATLFATHSTPILNELPHEIAIHPNYLGKDQPESKTISELVDLFPSAQGVRAHALYTHTHLIKTYINDYGFIYQSNYLMYLQPSIQPLELLDIIEIPIFFADDYHLMMWDTQIGKFDPAKWSTISKHGMKVFDFHPIHIFINTEKIKNYYDIKEHYNDPEKLRSFVHKGEGIRTILERLLNLAKERSWQFQTMEEVAEEFIRSKLTKSE
jgi:hypothetical protein